MIEMLSKGGLYVIGDCANISERMLLDKSEQILRSGVALFQYRNKLAEQSNKAVLAQNLQSLCYQYNTPFIINDDVLLAKKVNADGVHLGQDDTDINAARNFLGSKIIGRSCYNDIKQAYSAVRAGADYIAFGAFFPSPTKPNARRADIDLVRQVKAELSVPIVAIGGITPDNGKQLVDAGVDYLAIISGLYSVSDVIATTQSYNNLFK